MLNSETKQVLDALKKLTDEDGNYKIIEADEILSEIGDGEMTKLQLSSIIRDLRDRDYLKVKYLTPDEYCLLTVPRQEEIKQILEEVRQASVPAAVQPIEEDGREVPAASVKKVKPKRRILYFIWGFLGAFLGGAIVTAAALLLQIYIIH